MKEEELKRLIEKYYNGETSDEDEERLRGFFAIGEIPQGYESEKLIFGYYDSSERIPEPSAGFEDRIMDRIDDAEKIIGSRNLRTFLIPVISAAAGLLLLAGSYFLITGKKEPADTFSDPAIAYAETMKILNEVSIRLNRGTRELQPVAMMSEYSKLSLEKVNTPAIIVRKNLRSLNWLQKAIELTSNPVEQVINK